MYTTNKTLLVLIVLLTIVFYIMGYRDTRNQDIVVEMLQAAAADKVSDIAGE